MPEIEDSIDLEYVPFEGTNNAQYSLMKHGGSWVLWPNSSRLAGLQPGGDPHGPCLLNPVVMRELGNWLIEKAGEIEDELGVRNRERG